MGATAFLCRKPSWRVRLCAGLALRGLRWGTLVVHDDLELRFVSCITLVETAFDFIWPRSLPSWVESSVRLRRATSRGGLGALGLWNPDPKPPLMKGAPLGRAGSTQLPRWELAVPVRGDRQDAGVGGCRLSDMFHVKPHRPRRPHHPTPFYATI